MEKYETCIHKEQVGQIAVYVKPSCKNATMIKGHLVSTKRWCSKCKHWESAHGGEGKTSKAAVEENK